MTDLIAAPSPNFDDRKNPISLVILHYTGMESGPAALTRMRDPAAKVAAHYMIEQDGQSFQLIPEDKRAWHAGRGSWRGEGDINDISIGIELVNLGHYGGYEDFPPAQINALLNLMAGIVKRHRIPPAGVVGHSDIAPGRKEDPGEKFPWATLAQAGFALMPYEGPALASAPDYETSIRMLQEIGYGVELAFPVAASLAFQRRFCPADLGQGLSPLTRTAIGWVHGQILKEK